jgi:hypothetical protein
MRSDNHGGEKTRQNSKYPRWQDGYIFAEKEPIQTVQKSNGSRVEIPGIFLMDPGYSLSPVDDVGLGPRKVTVDLEVRPPLPKSSQQIGHLPSLSATGFVPVQCKNTIFDDIEPAVILLKQCF